MTTGTSTEVSFAHPPITEVALAVQFDSVPFLASLQAAALYQRWRDQYPNVRQFPEMEPMQPASGEPGILIRLGDPVGGRLWFQAAESDYLLQLQSDRFVLNWRRTSSNIYPRYPALAMRFFQSWATLEEVSESRPRPNRAEVTYVNQLAMGPHRVLEGWQNPVCAPRAGRVHATFDQQVEIPGGTDARAVTSVIGEYGETERTDLTLSVRVDLSADADLNGVLQAAHDHIVRRFKVITPSERHREWGAET